MDFQHDDLPLRRPEPEPFSPSREERSLLWDEDEALDAAEPELLGPARRPDRSWGTLAAAALLLVALLGAFLWYQRPSVPAEDDVRLVNPQEEPDAPPAEEPQVIEELPVQTEPEPLPEPSPVEPVQIAEPEPSPTARATRALPESPRPDQPVRIAEARPAPKRTVPSGPPESRMAGVLRPGPGVEMPIPLDFPNARYPTAARGRGLRVDVHLDILVGEQGQVLEAVVREGDGSGLGFNEAAVQAALGTRFQPATRWDFPGKAWTELIIQFEEAPSS